MRNLCADVIDRFRDRGRYVIEAYGWEGDEGHGVFNVPSDIDGATLRIIASSSLGWDHVSISRKNRCPNWIEMDQVKRLFFLADEVAMQLHVADTDHISVHPYCLHLWRPQHELIPMPPVAMVA